MHAFVCCSSHVTPSNEPNFLNCLYPILPSNELYFSQTVHALFITLLFITCSNECTECSLLQDFVRDEVQFLIIIDTDQQGPQGLTFLSCPPPSHLGRGEILVRVVLVGQPVI